jgi:hypothetical protein
MLIEEGIDMIFPKTVRFMSEHDTTSLDVEHIDAVNIREYRFV